MSTDLTGRLVLTVPEAGRLIGLGRDASYRAAETGAIPAHRVGRRIVVPTHALLREVLRWPDDLIAQALGLSEPPATPDSHEAALGVVADVVRLPGVAGPDSARAAP